MRPTYRVSMEATSSSWVVNVVCCREDESVWLSLTAVLLLATALCLQEQRNRESQHHRDEPLLSDASTVVMTARDERMQGDIAGLEAVCVRDYFEHRQLLRLYALLFHLAMKLRHTALAIFVRPDGSNVSGAARIGLLCASLCWITCATLSS